MASRSTSATSRRATGGREHREAPAARFRKLLNSKQIMTRFRFSTGPCSCSILVSSHRWGQRSLEPGRIPAIRLVGMPATDSSYEETR